MNPLDLLVDVRAQTEPKDKYLKYNLLKRIELWEQIIGQLEEYTIEVDSNIKYLDSIILDKEKEIKIVYWVFRPQDIGLR